MTAVLPTAPCADDPSLARLRALLTWLRGIDVCATCALDMALAQIEREQGRALALQRRCGRQLRTACEAKARLAWGEMPRRPA